MVCRIEGGGTPGNGNKLDSLRLQKRLAEKEETALFDQAKKAKVSGEYIKFTGLSPEKKASLRERLEKMEQDQDLKKAYEDIMRELKNEEKQEFKNRLKDEFGKP